MKRRLVVGVGPGGQGDRRVSGVTVEWPTEADAELHAEVHRVLAAVVAEEGAVGWLHVPDEAESAGWLESELSLARAGRGAFAAVRRHGRLEAMGVWGRFPAPVLAHAAEVRKVMVHPGARGAGLGRVVVEALTEHARSTGLEILLLDARGNNHGAHALYETLGWVEYGRIPNLIAVGDLRWDRVCYYKELQRPPGAVLLGSRPEGPGGSGRRAD